MKKLVLAVAALLTLAACGSSASTLEDADTFGKTIDTAGVVVLDVRTAGEFAAAHIPNAINIDVEGGSFESQIATLDKNVHYAVYCHSGRRSGIATEIMSKAGFTTLSELNGGLLSWNGPLVQS